MEGVCAAEEAATYGGVAAARYDPCYHQACDDIANLNNTALSQLSDGAAHATYTFAMTKTTGHRRCRPVAEREEH